MINEVNNANENRFTKITFTQIRYITIVLDLLVILNQ